MNTDTGRIRRMTVRAAALAALAVMTPLAAACGGSASHSADASSTAGASSAYQAELAHAHCMRSHGVPHFPDPPAPGSNSSGIIPDSAYQGVSQSTVDAAKSACQHLLPNGGQVSPAQQQQMLSQAVTYAKCMRSHGVPNFPDPQGNVKGVVSPISLQHSGVDTNSTQYQRASQACQNDLPSRLRHGLPGNGS